MPNYAARYGGSDDFKSLAARFRAEGDVGRGLRVKLRRDLKAIAEPIKRDVQAAARGLPAKGPKSTGLRAALASATKTNVSITGRGIQVRLQVDHKAMPQGQKGLPKLVEGTRRWRHPVFGHTDRWVNQAAHPFFYRTVESKLPAVQLAVIKTVRDSSKAIGR